MSDRPTILHTEASDGWGGQEIRILGEMTGMRERGHHVMLAAPSGSRIYRRALKQGIEAFPVEMDKAGFIRAVWEISGIVRKRRVSIINTHSSRDSWIGSIAGLAAGVRVVRTRHISSKLRKDPLTRLVYNRLADTIITTGVFVREQLIRDAGVRPDKVVSIPTGIDVPLFSGASGNGVRRSLGIAPDETVLGVAAVLRSWKGHDYLINAMPEILRKFPRVRLVLAGDGPRRARIEAQLAELELGDRVILTGHRDDIPQVINAFDVSLLVSYASEGVPQFLLQSMAAGKPLIGTRTGGIPEVIEDGVNGLLVEPMDPAAIAAAVIGLISDPERMMRMGEAGRAIVRRRYTKDRMLDDLEAVYDGLLR